VLEKAQENSEIAAKILLQRDSLNRRSTAPEAESMSDVLSLASGTDQ